MEVIKAQPVHNLDDDDDENYKISLDLVQVDRIYINI